MSLRKIQARRGWLTELKDQVLIGIWDKSLRDAIEKSRINRAFTA